MVNEIKHPKPSQFFGTLTARLFLLLLFAIHQVSPRSSPLSPCLWTDPLRNQTWRLCGSETFDESALDVRDWDIRQTWQADNCMDEFNRTQNCELRQNAELLSGHLVMSARPKKVGYFNYTGAKVIGNKAIGHGRLELRAAQPSGGAAFLRTCIILDTRINVYWGESSEVVIACFRWHANGSLAAVDRWVDFGAEGQVQRRPLILDDPDSLNSFHLYGIEWDSAELRFFFDHHYSEPVRFDANHTLQPKQFLTLRVGYTDLNDPELNSPGFDPKVQWKCPTLVVDYVRAYEKVSEKDAKEVAAKLPRCPPKTVVVENDRNDSMREFCLLAHSDPEWTPQRTFWQQYKYLIIFFSVTGTLITALLIYQTKLWLRSRKNWFADFIEDDGDHAYEYYEEPREGDYDYIYPDGFEAHHHHAVMIEPDRENYERLFGQYVQMRDAETSRQSSREDSWYSATAGGGGGGALYADMSVLCSKKLLPPLAIDPTHSRSRTVSSGELGGNSRCRWWFGDTRWNRRRSLSTPILTDWRPSEQYS